MVLEYYFFIFNDVSGFNSVEMLEVVKDYKFICILMYI